jgi:hypothetical protein
MRAKTVFTSLALAVLMTSLSVSQYSVTENFSYPTGQYIIGLGGAENGWADPWHLDPGDAGVSDSLFWVADTGISYQDMNYDYPHSGNVLVGVRPGDKFARYERTLDKIWTPDAGTTYWFSVFMEVKNDTDVSTWAGVKLAQDHTDAAVMFGKGHGLDKYTCGGGWHGSPDQEVSSTAWDIGPVWLVAEIFNMGEGNQNPVYMWINPDPSVQPDTSLADARSQEALNPGLVYVRVEYGGNVGFQVAFSDLRMGTTWADVSSAVTDVSRLDIGLPSQFALSQNYPNPFNPSTNIQYTLESSGKVRLAVYDLVGREVAVLVNGFQNSGSHQVVFSRAGLSSGIYFYTLGTANGVMTRKMVLLK